MFSVNILLKLHKTKAVKSICTQETVTFRLAIDLGLALIDFRTTRPWFQQFNLTRASDPIENHYLVSGQLKKKTLDLEELLTWALDMVTSYRSGDTLFWQMSIDHNGCPWMFNIREVFLLLVCILTRPTGSSKYGTTRKNIQQYYTPKHVIRCVRCKPRLRDLLLAGSWLPCCATSSSSSSSSSLGARNREPCR